MFPVTSVEQTDRIKERQKPEKKKFLPGLIYSKDRKKYIKRERERKREKYSERDDFENAS
jgi:hypothetical protein